MFTGAGSTVDRVRGVAVWHRAARGRNHIRVQQQRTTWINACDRLMELNSTEPEGTVCGTGGWTGV